MSKSKLTSPNDLTLEFHTIYDQPIRTEPVFDIPEKEMRQDLVHEEIMELEQAMKVQSIVDIADALGDIVYVCFGGGHAHGLDLDSAFGGAPGSTLFEAYKQEGNIPGAIPVAEHRDNLKALASMRRASAEYKSYIDFPESNDPNAVKGYLVFIVSGAYYISYNLGIPLDEVLQEIQKSNLSKLGEDGKPVKREDGKVLKGPNFFKPEGNIAKLLHSHGAVFTSEKDLDILEAFGVDLLAAEAEELHEKGEKRVVDLFSTTVLETPATDTFSPSELRAQDLTPETAEIVAIFEPDLEEEPVEAQEEIVLVETEALNIVDFNVKEDEELLANAALLTEIESDDLTPEEEEAIKEMIDDLDSSPDEGESVPRREVTFESAEDIAAETLLNEVDKKVIEEAEALTVSETIEIAENPEEVEELAEEVTEELEAEELAEELEAEELAEELEAEELAEELEEDETPTVIIEAVEPEPKKEEKETTARFGEEEPDFGALFKKD